MAAKTKLATLQNAARDQEDNDAIKGQHPALEIWRMFIANRAALVAMVVLVCIILLAIFGPLFYPTDPFEMVWMPFTPPGTDGFILGTDYLGRDLLAGLLHGGRVSITIGLVAALMSVFIGISFGAFAGYYRGYVEEVLMRITEFFQVLPTLLFSMVIVALFGASLQIITIAIGLVSWTAVARITRAEFLRIRELEYVTASRSAGATNFKLIFAIILPNALPPIIVQSALMVGSAILFEAGLAFLGLSDPNVVSWGQIIGSNRTYILDASYTVTIPGLAIFVTVLAISLIGDGLNDALNPKLRQR
ncbi:ABC transporter permease [Alphaproteobacteria bacterium]|jgi:peptide/nickel transport system permease protein|nr:ABC transporter permease [Alphaproteobacteria bacterium]